MTEKNIFPIKLKTLNDKERHDYILKTYILHKEGSQESRRYKRDIDVIRENHRFLWDDDAEANAAASNSWELRLARRYYDKLFKEYCIADLSRYKESKIALRWRTEAEVVTGTGQFQCGSRKCVERDSLRSWEVNFAYLEHGENKNALVKLRLCPVHSQQLNYNSKKREIKRLKRQTKDEKRSKKVKKTIHEQTEQTEIETLNGVSQEHELDNCDELEIPESSETTNLDSQEEDHIWSKQLNTTEETTSRETEFERYLEDLLL